MTFLAEPDDVKLILSNLKFKPFFPHSPGMVVLDAYDGINFGEGEAARDDCIDVAEQNYMVMSDHNTVVSAVSRECFHATATVHMNASPELKEILFLQKRFLGLQIATWIRFGVYFVAFVALIAIVRCCWQCCACLLCGRPARRGAQVGRDD